ncbi:MAG: TetR/AcrR family transcriptional regulator, ethionamide resistance regulator [Solirubrobacteraceae bacterium]|jgi:AcrR family transcriptional regulator|nr:TetR/AcrR family transcriptional regulator, ethionamide resistance regulator [Solirubrobacteraceae bacterium]
MASLSARSLAQTEKRAAVEAAVLTATESLLAEGRSFAELPVEEIATRAGISRTAFYFYFRGKRELLMRLTEGVAELLYRDADRWWSVEGDGEAALRDALRSIVALYAEHAVLLRAVVEASAYDRVVAEFWQAVVGRFVDATRNRIEAERLALPAQPTAFALCWMTERACYEWIVQGYDVDAPGFLEGLVGVWVRSLYGGSAA